MIGFGSRDTVGIDTGVARQFYVEEDHSSSRSSRNPWLSTTLPSCVIGT